MPGPFYASLGGSQYWLQMVDDVTRMGHCYFMSSKDQIGKFFDDYLYRLSLEGHHITRIRCDNAKENIKHLEDIAKTKKIKMEYTSPYTPQLNGVVERRIAVLKLKAQAMLTLAPFSPALKKKMWAEAVKCANLLENMTATRTHPTPPVMLFSNDKMLPITNLVEFGRIGFVTKPSNKIKNWTDRALQVLMVGYAQDHTSDTYRLYNPSTGKIIESRNVSWGEWSPEQIDLDKDIDPFAAVKIHSIDEDNFFDLWDELEEDIFKNTKPKAKKPPQQVPNPTVAQPLITQPPIHLLQSHVPDVIDIPIEEQNEEDDFFGQTSPTDNPITLTPSADTQDFDFRLPSEGPSTGASSRAFDAFTSVMKRVLQDDSGTGRHPDKDIFHDTNRQLFQQIDTPQPKLSREVKSLMSHNKLGRKEQNYHLDIEEYAYTSTVISDPLEPVTIQEALRLSEAECWFRSACNEVMKFIKRGSWQIVD